MTKDFLAEKSVQELQHPPYSPDLTPCDFFVFPSVKKKLRGKRFESAEAAVAAFVDGIVLRVCPLLHGVNALKSGSGECNSA